jgi:hypothetical protein
MVCKTAGTELADLQCVSCALFQRTPLALFNPKRLRWKLENSMGSLVFYSTAALESALDGRKRPAIAKKVLYGSNAVNMPFYGAIVVQDILCALLACSPCRLQ